MGLVQQLVAAVALAVLIGGLAAKSRLPRIPAWSIMAFASFMVVAGGLLPVGELGAAVDLDVVLFLIGMFSIVSMAESAGLLDAVAYWFLANAGSTRRMLMLLSLLFGLLAAFTVNDAVALMGPAIAAAAARIAGVDLEPLALLLAFSVTIGSVATPIGNPQNVLIAVQSGIATPLLTFLKYLLAPTLVNLLALPALISRWYRLPDRRVDAFFVPSEFIKSRRDAYLAGGALMAVIAALLANDAFAMLGLPHVENIGFIPFVAAAAIYIFSSEPRRVLEGVNWGTIVFFITMFITMRGIWNSGLLQPAIGALMPGREGPALGIPAISIEALLFSQALSNVPFTELFIQYMKAAGYGPQDVWAWLTLATAATVAGNVTLLGAASNIIILEVLESKYSRTLKFREFAERGIAITAINMALYLPFLYLAARL
ncbi:MAG: SLC13 family permease [Thermoproteus sp.]